jgi:hypothetical protein
MRWVTAGDVVTLFKSATKKFEGLIMNVMAFLTAPKALVYATKLILSVYD